jgi:hypothetical protein
MTEYCRDHAALARLESLIPGGDAKASSYWQVEAGTFTIDADGRLGGLTVLGIVSRRRGRLHAAAHWVLQAPFRRLGRRYRGFADSQALVRRIALAQGRQYTEDMLRQALAVAAIRHAMPDLPGEGAIVVIGDGFGVMNSLCRMTWPDRKVVAINLTKPLLLDLVQVGKALPGTGIALAEDGPALAAALADPGCGHVAVRADDAGLLAGIPIALAINLESMQEMNPPVIAGYFDLLRANPAEATAFYCCNRREKRLYDGPMVRFSDYPWHSDDRHLVDEVCPWGGLHYSTRPPFWHVGDRTKLRHRLSLLTKR